MAACLHQAQRGVQAVTAGVSHQGIVLGMAEFQTQTQPRLPQFQCREQIFSRDQALGCLRPQGVGAERRRGTATRYP